MEEVNTELHLERERVHGEEEVEAVNEECVKDGREHGGEERVSVCVGGEG